MGLLAAWGSEEAETKVAESVVPQEPPVMALTKEARDQMTPGQILAMWKHGNLRFREGRKTQRDFLVEQKGTASAQFPAGGLVWNSKMSYNDTSDLLKAAATTAKAPLAPLSHRAA